MKVFVKYLPIMPDEEIQEGMFLLATTTGRITSVGELTGQMGIDVAKKLPSIIAEDGTILVTKPYALTNDFEEGDEVFPFVHWGEWYYKDSMTSWPDDPHIVKAILTSKSTGEERVTTDHGNGKKEGYYKVLGEIPIDAAPAEDLRELDPETWHLSSIGKLKKYLNKEGVKI